MANTQAYKRVGDQRRPITPKKTLEMMLCVLITNADAFVSVNGLLSPKHFEDVSPHLSVIWNAVTQLYAENNELPDQHMIATTVAALVDDDPDAMDDEGLDAVNSFLAYAYELNSKSHLATNKVYADWAIRQVQRFLEERLAIRVSTELITAYNVIDNLPLKSQQIADEANRIAEISVGEQLIAYPSDWLEDPEASTIRISTGLPYFDKYMRGGIARGEVASLMGPYGAGKSTFAYMLGVNWARRSYVESCLNPDLRPEVSFVISYEDRLYEMRQRGLGYAAELPVDTATALSQPDVRNHLSTRDHLKEYERERFADAIQRGEPVLGEQERIQHAVQIINQHMVYLDMTGYTKPGVGGGGLNEIARVISQELRKRNARCGMVIIDYVGAMVKRYMATNNSPIAELRHYIQSTPGDARSRIANVFDCPVWLFHQLTGAANNLKSGVVASHTEAAEAKNYAENLNWSFSLGQPNERSLAILACTKHRGAKAMPPSVIRIDGNMYTIICADAKYMVNPRGKTIVDRADAAAAVRSGISPFESQSRQG